MESARSKAVPTSTLVMATLSSLKKRSENNSIYCCYLGAVKLRLAKAFRATDNCKAVTWGLPTASVIVYFLVIGHAIWWLHFF